MASSFGRRSARGGSAEDPNAYWALHPPEWDDPQDGDDLDCGQCAYFKRKRYRGRYIHVCQVHKWEVSNADYCADFEPKEDYELYDYEG